MKERRLQIVEGKYSHLKKIMGPNYMFGPVVRHVVYYKDLKK